MTDKNAALTNLDNARKHLGEAMRANSSDINSWMEEAISDIDKAQKALSSPSPAVDVSPIGWTGSGSLAAIKAGKEGYIFPTKEPAHPLPLYTALPAMREAWQLILKRALVNGNHGWFSSSDPPDADSGDAGFWLTIYDFRALRDLLPESEDIKNG